MHVFKRLAPDEFTSGDFLSDGIEALDDGRAFASRQDANLGQHCGMGLGATDILGPEAAIERDRFTETEHQFGGAGAEPAAPSRLSLLTCGHEVGMPLTSPAGKQGCLALANGLRLRRGSGLRQGGTTL